MSNSMKDIFSRIDEILVNDAKLCGLMNHKNRKEVPVGKEGLQAGFSYQTIRRGFQTEGNWKKLLTYYFQADFVIQDFSPNIREFPLVIAIHDRESDLNLYETAERVIELLDGADLTVDGKVHSYGCFYNGQIQSPTYITDLKSYRMSIRFSIQARKEI